MAIQITNLAIDSSDFTAVPSPSRNLFGNVFYKLNIIIDFEVHTFAIATSNREIEFAAVGFPDSSYIQDVNGGGMFTEFRSGDTILIQNAGANNGTYTNLIKIDNNTIRFIGTSFTANTSSTAEVYLVQTYSSIDYYYNLVDNSTQKYSNNSVGVAFSPMIPKGFQSWHIGSAQIKRTSVSATYSNIFQIEQEFYITPFFLAEFDLNTFPNFFLNNNCLKFIFKIDAKAAFSDNALVQTILFDSESGNTGYFNENYNTGLTNYSIANTTYTRLSDSQSLNAIQLIDTETTVIEFDVVNTVDSPFTASTDFVFSFINVPQDNTNYKQTATDLSYNFSFDRAKNTIGAAPVSGVNGITIDGFEISLTSSSIAHVTCNILINTATYNRISSFDSKYLVAISTQDIALSPQNSDGVTLSLDYRDFYVDLGLDAAITVDEETYIEHPYQTKIDGISLLESFTEDEVVGYKRFKIDTSLATQPFTISEVRAGIKATDGTNEFKLSEYKLPIQNVPIVNGIEFIDAVQIIPFKAPNTELVTKFSVKRDIASDAAPIYYYDVYFGWINRWEYWDANNNVNSDFFNIALANNGLNNNWERFDTLGYSLKFFVEWDLTVNGQTQTLSFESDFTINDYLSNPEWINEDIKTYDSSNNQLISGLNEYILGYDETIVVSEFEFNGVGGTPLNSEVDIIMRLEGYEIGGQFGSTRITSARATSTNTQWVSIDLSNEVVITSIGNVFYGTAKIDNFALQNFTEFSITARIYDKRVLENCILKENGEEILQENNIDCLLTELP
jgi:hypothetical protein